MLVSGLGCPGECITSITDLDVLFDWRQEQLAVEEKGEVMMSDDNNMKRQHACNWVGYISGVRHSRYVARLVLALVDGGEILAVVAVAVVPAPLHGAVLEDAGGYGCGGAEAVYPKHE